MNKNELKKLVANLHYEKVFLHLEALGKDVSALRFKHDRFLSMEKRVILAQRTYTTIEWNTQEARNYKIAYGLMVMIDEI